MGSCLSVRREGLVRARSGVAGEGSEWMSQFSQGRGMAEVSDAQLMERRGEAKRMQFEFSPEAVERLNYMKERTDASSYAEIVRDALRLYEWFIKQDEA